MKLQRQQCHMIAVLVVALTGSMAVHAQAASAEKAAPPDSLKSAPPDEDGAVDEDGAADELEEEDSAWDDIVPVRILSDDPDERRWQIASWSTLGTVVGLLGGTILSFATCAGFAAVGILLSSNYYGLILAFPVSVVEGTTRGAFATGIVAAATTSIVASAGVAGGGAAARVMANDDDNVWVIAVAAAPGLVVSGFGALGFGAAAAFGWLATEGLIAGRPITAEVFSTLGAVAFGLVLSAAGPLIALVGAGIANVMVEPGAPTDDASEHDGDE